MSLSMYEKDHPVWRDLTFCSDELYRVVEEGPQVVTAAPPQPPPTHSAVASEPKMPPRNLLIPPEVAASLEPKVERDDVGRSSIQGSGNASVNGKSTFPVQGDTATDGKEETRIDEHLLRMMEKKSIWTKEEDDLLIQMHTDPGCELTFQDVAKMTGRHVNAVKCRWYQGIKPRWNAIISEEQGG